MEADIEGLVEARREACVALSTGSKHQGTQGGRERHCVDGGDDNGYRHRHTKLGVEDARSAAHETNGDEDAHEDDGGRDEGRREALHRIDRGEIRRLVALVELRLDGFHHDDGVVHHRADYQDQSKERQQVKAKADEVKHGEGAYQTDHDGERRDERALEVLQEDIDDKHHEHDGLEERAHDIVDAGVEEVLCAHHVHEFHARGQLFLYLDGCLVDEFYYLVRVRARRLGNHAVSACVAVCAVLEGIVLYAELHASHVFEPQHTAVGKRLHYHVLVVSLFFVAPPILQDVLEGIVGIGAQRACRGLDVLLGKHIIYVGRHETIRSHLERVEPDAHTIACAPDVHLAHAGHSGEARFDVYLHVVGQEICVVGIRRTVKRETLDVARLTFTHRHAAPGDVRRQLSLRRSHAVLHVDHRHVGIRALFEEDADVAGTCVGGRGGHIHHVLHAVETLLEGNDNALLDGFRIRTSVVGTHADRRRSNLRELLDGQLQKANQPQHHNED